MAKTTVINQDFYVEELLRYWRSMEKYPEYRRDLLKFWRDIMAQTGELQAVYKLVVRRIDAEVKIES